MADLRRSLGIAAALLLVVSLAHAQPRVGVQAPEITGTPWLNSAPLNIEGLKGRVVLVEFWTHG